MTHNSIREEFISFLSKSNYSVSYTGVNLLYAEKKISDNEKLMILISINLINDGTRQSYSKDNLFEGERLLYATSAEFINVLK